MPNEPHRRVEVAKMKWVRWVFGPNDQNGIYFLNLSQMWDFPAISMGSMLENPLP
jgi:hypothetical protein